MKTFLKILAVIVVINIGVNLGILAAKALGYDIDFGDLEKKFQQEE